MSALGSRNWFDRRGCAYHLRLLLLARNSTEPGSPHACQRGVSKTTEIHSLARHQSSQMVLCFEAETLTALGSIDPRAADRSVAPSAPNGDRAAVGDAHDCSTGRAESLVEIGAAFVRPVAVLASHNDGQTVRGENGNGSHARRCEYVCRLCATVAGLQRCSSSVDAMDTVWRSGGFNPRKRFNDQEEDWANNAW